MPGDNSEGMLEDLCLRTKAEMPIMECVNVFIECASAFEKLKNYPKAKCQAYLSVMPDIVSSVGLGAIKRYWDFRHEAMARIIDFIQCFAS